MEKGSESESGCFNLITWAKIRLLIAGKYI
jgi:hypothetical protein